MAERRTSLDMKAGVDAIEDVVKNPHHESYDASGTVNLYQDGTVVLVPTPSPDPKGTFLTFTPHRLLLTWR
jgi:hypothetical protein